MQAMNRIWTGKGMQVWEVVSWTVLAVYLGFRLNDVRFIFTETLAFRIGYLLIFVLTPLLVPAWVYRVHIVSSGSDEPVRTVPLSPIQVLGPRMLAVLVTWLRAYAPWILLVVLADEFTFSGLFIDPLARWDHAAAGHFFSFPYLGGWNSAEGANLPFYITETLFLYVSIAYIIGWILTPIAWAFLWGTVFQRKPGGFLFAYTTLIVIMSGLILLGRTSEKYQLSGSAYRTQPVLEPEFTALLLVIGCSGLLLSVVSIIIACKVWGRRAR